jgi:hypothetical protein
VSVVLDSDTNDAPGLIAQEGDGNIMGFGIQAVPHQFDHGLHRVSLMGQRLYVICPSFQLNTHEITMPLADLPC